MNAFQIPERSYFAGDPAFYFDAHGKQFKEPVIKEKRPYRVCAPIDVGALKEYRARRKSQSECACKFGISIDTVRKLLNEPKLTRVKRIDIDCNKALKARLQGFSLREIAKKHGVSNDTVRQHLCEKSLPQEVRDQIAKAVEIRRGKPKKRIEIFLTEQQERTLRALGWAAWLRAHLDSVVG